MKQLLFFFWFSLISFHALAADSVTNGKVTITPDPSWNATSASSANNGLIS